MQQFFVDYGLYLLIALLIGIAVIFLATRGKNGATADDVVSPPPVANTPTAPPPATPDTLVVPDPVPIIAVPPLPLVEPIAAEPTPAPVPAPLAEAVSQPAKIDDGDDLLRLKGVGPKLKTQLTELGITRFAQIAAWSESDLATIDAQLGAFKGRPVRDQWIDQAKYLAAGDIAGFEAKYGKI